jgi:20S proteasome alpha/beta subunit
MAWEEPPKVYKKWHRPEDTEMPMSMVISIAAKEVIVIAADTICVNGDETAHYNDSHSKLYRASNPHFAIGLAGSKGADRFLKPRTEWSSLDFDGTLLAYKAFAFEDYKKENTAYDFFYLICGYDRDGEPRIERVRFVRDNYNAGRPYSDIEPVRPRHAIGIEKHGAWYLLSNYFQKDMTTDHAMFLAYFILSEVIRHDERTRGPIEMMLVRKESPVENVSVSSLEEIDRETKKRIQAIESIVKTPFVLSVNC